MIEQRDARVHRFQPGAFDVAIGRSGVMFVADAAEALRRQFGESIVVLNRAWIATGIRGGDPA